MNTTYTRFAVGAVASTFLFATPSFAWYDGPLRATAERATPNHWTQQYSAAQLKKAALSLNSDYVGESSERSHWKKDKLTVYVDFSHTQKVKWFNQKLFASKCDQIMKDWNDAVDHKFVFEKTADKMNADIFIKFDTFRYKQPNNRTGFTRVFPAPEHGIQTSEIAVLLLDAKGNRYSDWNIERTAYHEFGHALGLMHSANEDDIMYPASRVTVVSPRDCNSVRRLYGLPERDTISRICDRSEIAVQ